MRWTGLLTAFFYVLNIISNDCKIQGTTLDTLPIRGLLNNETNVYGSRFEQDDYSGNYNDSEASGDFGDQLQIPNSLNDLLDDDLGTKATDKSAMSFSGSGQAKEEEPTHQLFGNFGQQQQDWDFESSGDSQMETGISDGHPAVTETIHVHPLTRIPVQSVPRHPFSLDVTTESNLNMIPLCAKECSHAKHQTMKVVSTGGNTIPSAVEMTLHCSVHSHIDEHVSLTWYLPNGVQPSWTELNRINQSIKVTETAKERVTLGIFRLYNVSEMNSGSYVCQATYNNCCQRNVTVNVNVYTPPSIASDMAIVLAVCFIELVLVIFFKTRSEKDCTSKPKRSLASYSQVQLTASKA